MAELQLSGKVAVVTGGASGIGLASAIMLHENGAHVIVVDLDHQQGQRAAEELGGTFIRADVSASGDWHAISAAARDAGGADIVHLNAGVTTDVADITAITDAGYRRIMGANVDGVVFGVRAMAPSMAARGGGSIVVTASLAGLIAFSPDPVYTLTKHAVVGLVRSLVPQLETMHITINAICPGLVDTPLLGAQARELVVSAGFPLIPPEDIAQAVLGCVTSGRSGDLLVCQAGADPVPYRYAGVPGPRDDRAKGKVPPPGLAAFDQASKDS